MKTLFLSLILAAGLMAQTTINGSRTILGAWDASSATSTKPSKSGTSLPGTCSVGEEYFKTDATAGANKYGCTATNTWTALSGSGSGGTTNQNYRYIVWSVDGQGSAITAVTSCKPVDFSGTINQLTATADVSGGVTLDLRTVAHSGYTGPGSASSITNSNLAVMSAAAALTRSAANMSTDGWTTTLAASSDMCLVISSPSTITRLAVAVRVSAN